MIIAVRSEVDSRIFVYPLIKCLYNFGSIGVYTSNHMFSRLIENELEGGFKNVTVMVSPEVDLEGVMRDDDYYVDKYDFLIIDNMGAVDYDIMFAVVTNRLTDLYVNDLVYIVADDKTRIIKFGKAAPKPKAEKPPKEKKPPKQKRGAPTPEEVQPEPEPEPIPEETPEDDISDDDFNKWKNEKTDEDILREKLGKNDAKWLKFPTFDQIELMEGRHYMMVPGDDFVKEIYKHLKEYLNVDERNFSKGARVKDESSSDITGTDVW